MAALSGIKKEGHVRPEEFHTVVTRQKQLTAAEQSKSFTFSQPMSSPERKIHFQDHGVEIETYL